MNPNTTLPGTGLTAQDRLDALDQYRNSLKALAPQAEALLRTMSDADLVNYYDRLRMFGEPAAVQWAAEKYSTQQ